VVRENSKGNEKFLSNIWKGINRHGGIIAIISLVISICSSSVMFLQYYNEYIVPKRADLKIVVDPYEASWVLSSDKATFSVNGSLYNPSSMAAKVLQYKLSVIYTLPSGNKHILSTTFENISQTWNVANDVIGEIHFHLSMHIFEEFVVDEAGQIVPIRENKPKEFQITVTYDDGLGLQTKERTFTYPS